VDILSGLIGLALALGWLYWQSRNDAVYLAYLEAVQQWYEGGMQGDPPVMPQTDKGTHKAS
jgi:hypothetical protein